MLRVEIESSVTIHLSGDHYVKERRLLDMDANDLTDMSDKQVVTSMDTLDSQAVWDALAQVHADMAEDILDALASQIDEVTGG